MKKYFVLLMALCAVLSCSKQALDEKTDVLANSVTVNIHEFVASDATKATINPSGLFAWTDGDTISVWPKTVDPTQEASQIKFTLFGEASGATATFKGSGWGMICDNNFEYFSYFPYDNDDTKEAVTVTYDPLLIQSSDNNTDHLSPYLYMYAPAIKPQSASEAAFDFYQLSALARFVITLPAEAAEKKFVYMKIEASEDLFGTSVTYNPSTTSASEKPVITVNSATNSFRIKTGEYVMDPTEGTLTLWYIMCPATLEDKTLTVTLKDIDGFVYSADYTCNKNQESGKAYNYNVTVTKVAEQPAHPAIDMGTGDGVLWATMNIGGSSYIDEGSLFAFGETTARTVPFTPENYKFYDAGTTSYTKYNTVNDELSTEDDAAYVNWGEDWRIPSKSQFLKLVSEIDYTCAERGNSTFYFRSKTDICNVIGIYKNCGTYATARRSQAFYVRLNSIGKLENLTPCANTTYYGNNLKVQVYSICYEGVPVRPVKVN